MPAKSNLGFLGAGKMATALARGILRAGPLKPGQMLASDPVAATRAAFSRATGARVVASNLQVLGQAEWLILAVKPSHVNEVLAEVRPRFTPKHLLLSIAAGVTLHQLEAALPEGARVIRVMPNTPALVGASASALAAGQHATSEDAERAVALFRAVGLACLVPESLLDAVTGLSGSGPAYVFLMIEALSDGGVAAGLPRELATRLAAQTVVGAGRMVLESGLHPGALKDMVASPAGTTIEGLQELEKAAVRGAFMQAVRASADKARRMGQR